MSPMANFITKLVARPERCSSSSFEANLNNFNVRKSLVKRRMSSSSLRLVGKILAFSEFVCTKVRWVDFDSFQSSLRMFVGWIKWRFPKFVVQGSLVRSWQFSKLIMQGSWLVRISFRGRYLSSFPKFSLHLGTELCSIPDSELRNL